VGLEGEGTQDAQEVLPDAVQSPVGEAENVNRLVAGVSQLCGLSSGQSLVKDSQVRIRSAFLSGKELIAAAGDGNVAGVLADLLGSSIPGVVSSVCSQCACSMCTGTKPYCPSKQFFHAIQSSAGIQQCIEHFGWSRT
jgi:hypothetical protein